MEEGSLLDAETDREGAGHILLLVLQGRYVFAEDFF